MACVELIPARAGHAIEVARRSRAAVTTSAERCGIDVRRAVRAAVAGSRRSLALRVDGRVVAIYGIVGALVSGETTIWLHAARGVARHLVAACQHELAELIASENRLVAYIAPDDDVALRFVRHWGFRADGELPNGMRRVILDTKEMRR
jgi:hypothetical protein